MRRVLASLAAAAALAAPVSALAWGATGHRMIGVLAEEALPPELPAFLRTPQAIAWAGELAREPDRSKGAGKTHDTDRDADHFLDLLDDGTIPGGTKLADLPATRAEYETLLRAGGADSWQAGSLPYSIISGWQQLTKDFGLWRALSAAERRATDPQRQAWFGMDRQRREALILADLGYLAHMVGDGAQPLHVTEHFNGWGQGPNPEGFTLARIHRPFEGALVHDFVKLGAVRAAMPAPRDCACAIDARVKAYLAATGAQVMPLYRLEKAGGLNNGDARGVAFATARLAAGAGELRDLIAMAWAASAQSKVGWPEVSVADVEAGRVDPYDALMGDD